MSDSARIVIIGGGVGGASVAYHLTRLGERDVVLLERDELTSGSTFHSAGLVGQLRADPTLTRMNQYSVELYRTLDAGWTECGGIKLAATPERMAEIRRQIGWARTFGLPLEEISVAEAVELFPLMDPEGVVGAAYLPTDGQIDPSQLCYALATRAREGGATVRTRTRVLGVKVVNGRVAGVSTDQGDIDCEIVVNCGGMFAAEIGRMAGYASRSCPCRTSTWSPTPSTTTRACPRCATPTCSSTTGRRFRAWSWAGTSAPAPPGRPGRTPTTPCRPTSTAGCWPRTGRGSRRSPATPGSGCPPWPTSASAS
ncbi:FAD-dependent oxidoreductase [Nonomuraea antimicrobica]